jgi:hypothetical protein
VEKGACGDKNTMLTKFTIGYPKSHKLSKYKMVNIVKYSPRSIGTTWNTLGG